MSFQNRFDRAMLKPAGSFP